jgi:hypothetical protein
VNTSRITVVARSSRSAGIAARIFSWAARAAGGQQQRVAELVRLEAVRLSVAAQGGEHPEVRAGETEPGNRGAGGLVERGGEHHHPLAELRARDEGVRQLGLPLVHQVVHSVRHRSEGIAQRDSF